MGKYSMHTPKKKLPYGFLQALPELCFPIKGEVNPGVRFFKHLICEGYAEGYISDILDIYKPDLDRGLWVFHQRVRKHRPPYHTAAIGRNMSCDECKRWHKKYPKPPKDLVIFSGSKFS